MEKLLKSLNGQQLKPVLDTEGAVLVTAGAGSGKTRVLTSRIIYLIREKKVNPYNILAITFTNKAAAEMQERLESHIGKQSGIWVCTIHKMCVLILRQNGHKIGYDSRFTIYTDAERERVLKKLFKILGIEDERTQKSVKYHIDRAKMLGESPEEYSKNNADERYVSQIKKVYTAYERELKTANALDFDDLLIKTYELLAYDKESLEHYSKRFKYILVDEFQDTNALQYRIIKMLTIAHGNIFAVGDDDQSIYGWRGADIENILNFEHDFKGAKLYKLEQNYRSTKNILDAANYVIKNNASRRDKRLWTDSSCGDKVELFEAESETDEAIYTASIIQNKIAMGESASDFVVLMRLNALSRAYEQQFTRFGISTRVIGGQKFYDRKEIKDIIAYLRLINNPSDNDAFLRIINVPRRGIGDRSVEAIIEIARAQNITLYDVLLDLDSFDIPPASLRKFRQFKELLSGLIIDSQTLSIFELVKNLIERTDFLSSYETPGIENENRRSNIDEFLASIEEFAQNSPSAALNEYLNTITLSTDVDNTPETDSVTLATIHSVKGLEFKTVFICGLDDGILPISRQGMDDGDLEEERRLMYVAITRARQCLFLTRAKSRFLYGDRKQTVRSRFLSELAGIAGIKYKGAKEQNLHDLDGFGNRDNQKFGQRGTYSFGGRHYNNEVQELSAPQKSIGGVNLAGALAARKAAVNTNAAAFKTGILVAHPKFGEGTIIAIKGQGAHTIADVAFKDKAYGIKQLSLSVAPLKIL